MKRLFYLLLILLSVNLIGCVEDVTPEEPEIETPKPETETPKPEIETPEPEIETPGPETETPEPEIETPEEDVDNPSNYTPLEIIDFLTSNLANEKNYLKSTIGTSKTLSGFSVEQEIENNTYVYPEYVYAHYSSDSTVVTFNHKALLYNDIVNYSHAGKLSTKWYLDTNKNDYKKQYGILADSVNFTGYVINEETVLDSKYSFEDDCFIFEYNLDLNLSCEDMKVQMKEFGGLVSLPEFEEIKVTIYLDYEFNILKIQTNEIYNTVKKVIVNVDTKLEQNLITTFTKFEDNVNLPNLDKYL